MKNIWCMLGRHQWKTVGYYNRKDELESKLYTTEMRICTRCYAYENFKIKDEVGK